MTSILVPSLIIITFGSLIAWLKPTIQEAGLFRTVLNLNNQRCHPIHGLEACEDIYVDHPSGLAYLACSQLNQRLNWIPAMDIVNFQKLPDRSPDYIAILDLETREYKKLDLTNLPKPISDHGLNLHGIDLYISPSTHQSDRSSSGRKATIYLINHRPPARDDADRVSRSNDHPTPDSVIEVFDTIIGSGQAVYRRTIQDDLILTPNNLVGLNDHSFYVTNDRSKKPSPTRAIELFLLNPAFDNVIHCSFEDHLKCIPALHARYPFPNGIAKGPGRLIYMSNSLSSHLRLLEIEDDKTLTLKQEIKIPRILDNLYVTLSGSVFMVTVPSFFKFKNALAIGRFEKDDHVHRSRLISPTEVWKLSNRTTGLGSSDNSKINTNTTSDAWYQLEKVFADDGQQVSGTTGVAVWNSNLLMTGIASPHLSICRIQSDLAPRRCSVIVLNR